VTDPLDIIKAYCKELRNHSDREVRHEKNRAFYLVALGKVICRIEQFQLEAEIRELEEIMKKDVYYYKNREKRF